MVCITTTVQHQQGDKKLVLIRYAFVELINKQQVTRYVKCSQINKCVFVYVLVIGKKN